MIRLRRRISWEVGQRNSLWRLNVSIVNVRVRSCRDFEGEENGDDDDDGRGNACTFMLEAELTKLQRQRGSAMAWASNYR